MKVITLKEACDILENCSGVIYDGFITYPNLSPLEGSDENEFLYIAWGVGDLKYNVKFNEGENRNVAVVGSSMFLVDSEGEICDITILERTKLD
jgi:hypothetical protein